LERTLVTYVYSHCNISNIQMKIAETFGKHTCNICNIQIKTYATSKIKHMKHTSETHIPSVELDAHGHPSREQQMAHIDAGPSSSHELPGWSFSLWSPHTLVTPRMNGPHRCMRLTPSEWPHALPSADQWKGQVWSSSNCNCVRHFFLLGFHAVGQGPSGRPNVLNQAFLLCSFSVLTISYLVIVTQSGVLHVPSDTM
jgi:hypothetical protein